jgi:hypothetical protein
VDVLKATDVVGRAEATAGESLIDDYLIVDLGSGRYFGVGEVGRFIWARLDGRRDLAAVAAEVAAHYRIPLPQAVGDLLELAQQLVEAGLAKTIDTHSSADRI